MNDLQSRFTSAMNGFFETLEGTVGVMVMVPVTGLELTYNHDQLYPTASTLKVPLLYELYRQADAGMIDLTNRMEIRDEDRVPGSGVLQALDSGLQPTVRDLGELMITVSDNYATDLLFAALGKEQVARTLSNLGLTQTSLPLTIREMFCAMCELDPADPDVTYLRLRDALEACRPAADNLAYACTPENDTSSPADMVKMMDIIERGEGMSEEGRDGAIRILKNQNFNTIIPARLPDNLGIETAHKTGSIRGVRNDVGTVYGPGLTYHIAFMSKQLTDTPEAVLQMARASRWIWDLLASEFPSSQATT